jgi:uncharacterized HAD superfamily protein/adenine/guanine phosphoribosyltransferase-like PRPP-binding protein
MNFRSLADLIEITRKGTHLLPEDVDLIVGIPRSGILPAAVIALLRNKPLIDLDGFLAGRMPGNGLTRKIDIAFEDIGQVKRILVVDDSVLSGRALEDARRRLVDTRPDVEVITCAAVVEPGSLHRVDYYFDTCPIPRIFEWNLFNSPFCEKTCFDLDGIFCPDPTDAQNDDGAIYLQFLREAAVINRPGHKLRRIVTSRLECYRPQTEAWLAQAGIEYEKLDMLEGVTAEERRSGGLHPAFKARVYAGDRNAELFVESDPKQAREIARASGKPVLDFENMILVQPTAATLPYIRQASLGLMRRLRNKLRLA